MTTHWTDRLSEYMDGHLRPDEAKAAEAHLAECAECSALLAQLRAVSHAARQLEDRPPAQDLWAGIQEAIRQPDPDAQIIDIRQRTEVVAGSGLRRTVRMSVPQLIAAGLALALVSGGTAWWVRPDAPSPGPLASGTEAPVVQVSTTPGTEESPDQADELAQLQELLDRHRDQLSPNTVRILEKNLAAIDRAIQESLDALAADPGNEFLEGHLERARERKLEYLREASAAFQWST